MWTGERRRLTVEMWDWLDADVQALVLEHAASPTWKPVLAKVGLRDVPGEGDRCAFYANTKGHWNDERTEFTCFLDLDRIPEWDETESSDWKQHFEFRIRKKGSDLVLANPASDSYDDGWVKIGVAKRQCFERYPSLHLVKKSTTDMYRTDCVLYGNTRVAPNFEGVPAADCFVTDGHTASLSNMDLAYF